MSAYFSTFSVVWSGHDVKPTSKNLDDLDASRTGIYHQVMYTTSSRPSMFSHMNWCPCYQDACFYVRMHTSYTQRLAFFSYDCFPKWHSELFRKLWNVWCMGPVVVTTDGEINRLRVWLHDKICLIKVVPLDKDTLVLIRAFLQAANWFPSADIWFS